MATVITIQVNHSGREYNEKNESLKKTGIVH